MQHHRIAVVVQLGHEILISQRVSHRRTYRLIVRTVVSPPLRSEVRVVIETDAWRHHVSEPIHLVAEPLAERRIESVQLRGQTHSHIEVKHVVESLRRIAVQTVLLLVPRLVNALEVHPVVQVDRRRDSQVLKHRKVRADRYAVRDLVLPVLGKIRLKEVTLLAGYTVRKCAGITQRYTFIPPLFAYCFLALERIHRTHVHIQARGCH